MKVPANVVSPAAAVISLVHAQVTGLTWEAAEAMSPTVCVTEPQVAPEASTELLVVEARKNVSVAGGEEVP